MKKSNNNWTPLSEWAQEQGITSDQALHLYQHQGLPPYLRTKETKKGDVYIQKEIIRRAIKVSLKHLTSTKQRMILGIIERYRNAVNQYIQILWNQNGSWDAATLALVTNSYLSQRYLSQALTQATEVVSSTKKSAKALKCANPKQPKFTGHPVLDAKFISLEASKTCRSYDFCARLSTLKSGHPITLPFKATKILRKWLKQGDLIDGCELHQDHLILWVKIPTKPYKTSGSTIAIDTNYQHLLVDSQHRFHADPEWMTILNRLQHRKRGSQGFRRSQEHRKNYFNRILNRFNWEEMRFFGIDDLTGIKTGKKSSSRRWRKARAPWRPWQVRMGILQRCQENRVYPVAFDPRNTSRECPQCNKVSKFNRQGETFECVFCGYVEHADIVGAVNGLARTRRILGSLESPSGLKR